MIVIGIDPGASCGVAAVTEHGVAWTTVSLPSWRQYESPVHAIDDQATALLWAIDDLYCLLGHPPDEPALIVVEDSRHAQGATHAAMQGWHLALVAHLGATSGIGDTVRCVAPSTWQWGLVGAQGRDEYVRFAREMTGGELTPKEHDAAAAICLAEWGWQQQRGGDA